LDEYDVGFATSAGREFRALPPGIKRRVAQAVERLRTNPRPRGVRKLEGDDRLYRVRVGDYRVIFAIDDRERSIRVTRVRHRRDVYQ
jgi:mRNA interferase RelE/StbE